MAMNQLYAVTDNSGYTVTDLTAREAVRHIYTDDGGDYRLEPKMLTNRYDDDDNELPDIQETTDTGDLVFIVSFKDSCIKPWRVSMREAIGKNEDDSLESFLQESFEQTYWDDTRWHVSTMEEFLKEQAENTCVIETGES